MLCTNSGLLHAYDWNSPDFQAAYRFLQQLDPTGLEDGAIAITDRVKAFVQSYTTLPSEEARFETHDAYFDIQLVVEGEEYIGVAPRAALKETVPYDPVGDITFYKSPANATALLLRAGDFAVLAPEEAHQPRCCVSAPSFVKKIVIKVPVKA